MNILDPYGYMIPEIFYEDGFCPQYQAVYDSFTIPVSDAVAEAQDQMVRGMIADGIWAKLDIFYITSAQSPMDSLINWINPGTHDLTVHNLLVGNFTEWRGWTGNGVNGYLNTNYNPFSDGINYALDDASIGVYVRTNVEENVYDIGAYQIGAVSYISTRYGLNNVFHKINDNTESSIASLDSRGFWITNRTAVNSKILYKNKNVIINTADVSTAIPNTNLYILSFSNMGVANTFSTKQIAAVFAGGGQAQTNVDNLTDRLETFMDYIGAGVIP